MSKKDNEKSVQVGPYIVHGTLDPYLAKQAVAECFWESQIAPEGGKVRTVVGVPGGGTAELQVALSHGRRWEDMVVTVKDESGRAIHVPRYQFR